MSPCPVFAILYRRCGFRPVPKEQKDRERRIEVPTMYNTERIPDGDPDALPVLESWREKRRKRE